MFARFILAVFLTTSLVSSDQLLERFSRWSKQFNIAYSSDAHYDTTFRKWTDNDAFIERINAKNFTYSLGHNQFSGMDADEFRSYLWRQGIMRGEPDVIVVRDKLVESAELSSLPVSVDWTKTGAVTPVKDQGQCGSCWSFSTTGALEGAYFLKYASLASFSEQQLVDCDTLKNGGRDHGCNGGLMDNAFSWINKNGGLCSEEAYPYVSGTTKTAGTCQTTCKVVSGSGLAKYVDVAPSDDVLMMTAVSMQPVAVAIEADQREFQLYKSGVFTGTCGTNLDHGVLVTGYGTLNNVDYYAVKNSWGTSWGLNGYILLGKGTNPDTNSAYNHGNGQCGVLMEASYPVL
jgi:C1A family cysteine protease